MNNYIYFSNIFLVFFHFIDKFLQLFISLLLSLDSRHTYVYIL